MPRRVLLLLPAAAIAIGAIAWAAQSPSDAVRVTAPPAPPEPVFDRVVEARNGDRFASTIEGKLTRVERLTPVRALITVIEEPVQLRLADQGGKRLALANPIAPDADAYNPGPRPNTHLVLLDVATKQTRAYDFESNLEPEAFGIDNSSLFVIDHRPATNPTFYRLSAIDLSNGHFWELLSPKKQPLEDMTGTARQQVASRSGAQLYTLYVQHGHSSSHEGVDPNALPVAAFIHVLDLGGNWAACVDLPGFGHGPVAANNVTLSPDGETLTVTDTFAGKQATVATGELTTTRMIDHPPAVRIEPLATSGA